MSNQLFDQLTSFFIPAFMVLLFIFCVALLVENEIHNYRKNKKRNNKH